MHKLILLAALLAPLGALARDCQPAPLQGRELFLRGTLNNWAALDEHQFRWACDRHELVAKLEGEHSFKIADEDWSPDADWGGTGADALSLKGAALQRRFEPGIYCLSFKGLRLDIAACPGRRPSAELPEPVLADPLARSLRFDSRLAAFKTPYGAVPEHSLVDFRLQAAPGVESATLVIERRRLEGNQELLEYLPVARVPMQREARGFRTSYRFGAKAIYGYYFEVQAGGRTYIYQNNKDNIFWTREKGSMGVGLAAEKPEATKRIRRYRQTVHAADFQVPAWARDIVYYQVFPERFRNGDKRNDPQPGRERYQDQGIERHERWMSRPYKPNSGDGSDAVYNNDFFGGDLAGIIQKLDEIRELGANTLYLTPIFRAPSNHKYDTADYLQVDPAFGTNADFERLTLEAAKRGLRVIPDTSLNHVGSDSPYFNRFGNYPAGGAFDGGKLNTASPYASWFKLDPSQPDPSDQYQGWVGIKDLPEIDKASPAFRAFAYGNHDSVMKVWLDRGAAGWRMDVAPWVPDDFWREWRAAIKAHKPEALTVAETWFDASKYLLGDSFDSAMNYIFRSTVLDYAAGGRADRLYQNLELLREAYPRQALDAMMNLLSSHDQPRALHHLGYRDDGNQAKLADAKRRLLLAMFFQMTYPGAPTIYYGDEVGLGGGEDPYNRAPYPWADEGGSPDLALRAAVRRLTQLRHALPLLRHGSLEAPLLLDEHAIVLLRRDGAKAAIVAMNNAEQPRRLRIPLPRDLQGARFRDALDGSIHPARQRSLELLVPALSGRVLLWK
jgi:glycosidase